MKTKILNIDNYKIELTRKKIKNINMRIIASDSGAILKISSPLKISDMQIENFVLSKRDWIEKNLIKVEQRHINKNQTNDIELEKLRENLREKSLKLVSIWEYRMGVSIKELQIRKMKTRWGSCNIIKKKICLNLHLAVKPVECLEYVIVHELCHLLEPSHNKRFKAYMTHYLPDWQLKKKILNE